MMFRIVTLPEWESRVPKSFRREGESYWTTAKIPLEDEWVFLVRTTPFSERYQGSLVLMVVTVEKLLDLMVELGDEGIQSIHHLFADCEGDGFGLEVTRLACVDVAENSEDGWRRVFLAESDSGELVAEVEHRHAIGSMVNRTRVASFPIEQSSTS